MPKSVNTGGCTEVINIGDCGRGGCMCLCVFLLTHNYTDTQEGFQIWNWLEIPINKEKVLESKWSQAALWYTFFSWSKIYGVPLETNNLSKALIRRTGMNFSDMGYVELKGDGKYCLSHSKERNISKKECFRTRKNTMLTVPDRLHRPKLDGHRKAQMV